MLQPPASQVSSARLHCAWGCSHIALTQKAELPAQKRPGPPGTEACLPTAGCSAPNWEPISRQGNESYVTFLKEKTGCRWKEAGV